MSFQIHQQFRTKMRITLLIHIRVKLISSLNVYTI